MGRSDISVAGHGWELQVMTTGSGLWAERLAAAGFSLKTTG
jgi:hypothetical protein